MFDQLPRPAAAALIALAALAAGCASPPPAALVTTDAERLAALLQRPGLPSAAELQAAVLDPGSPGVRIFTPHRIQNADNLARAIAADPAAYRKAATLCLPAAQAMQAEADALMARVARLLGETMPAPAYVLFGAGNSGGTAGPDGLALGLEVLCAGIETPAAARAILMDFVAHEIAHVYQSRQPHAQGRPTLLHQALVEGFADYVMEQVRGPGQQGAAAERQRFGLAHEAALWQRFQADVARGAPWGTWMYDQRAQPGGQPPDMGYWIGKRICEAYVARAADRAQALRSLLALRDAGQILRDSGYGPR